MSRPILALMVLIGMVGLSTLRGETEPEQFVRQLGDSHFRTRKAAEEKLVALGRQSVSALQGAVNSGDLELRRRAERALQAIKTSPEYLVEELRSEPVWRRMEAIEKLRQLGEQARPAIPLLLTMLEEKDESIRGIAAAALSSIDPGNKVLENEIIPAKAHGNGNYSLLLRKILVPQDCFQYGKFYEFGLNGTPEWAGHRNIPPGYWVYVYPHWYIWGSAKSLPLPIRNRTRDMLRARQNVYR
jgi:hypothetical protein